MHQESRAKTIGTGVQIRSNFSYRLTFIEEASGLRNDVEFEAPDAAMALIIARREAGSRPAELWRDGRKVCTMQRTTSGVWSIR